ncbi:uncharacterized protein LOC118433351 [Folsomia candida]|uniref:uncharacterized protein LOC118433351 n=1 Tax=Folsomia candida TaxID=158441 RepID=UPI001605046A|nr:uncharacterized protein LOC118433351 [Folsomia candida]
MGEKNLVKFLKMDIGLQNAFATNKRASTLSIESDLLEIGKSIIRSNQLIGYLPMTCVTSSNSDLQRNSEFKRLLLCPKSVPFVWSVCLIFYQIISYAMWPLFFAKHMYNKLLIDRSTEKIAMTASLVLAAFIILGRHIYGLVGYRKTLKFWSQFVNLVHKFEGPSGQNHLKSDAFMRIKVCINRVIVENAVVTLLYGTFCLSTFILNPEEEQCGIAFYYGHMITAMSFKIMACTHIFIEIWMTFPVRVIQGLLHILRQELDDQLILSKDGKLTGKVTLLRESWIEDYHTICTLAKLYTHHFEKGLILEIGYNSVQMLCQIFSTLSLVLSDMVNAAIARCTPIAFSFRSVYQLANESDKLCQLHKEIYERLCTYHGDLKLNEELKYKIESLLREMTVNDLSIQPGRYFNLDRKLVTSIMSTIITFVIILVQFRNGDK